MRTPAATKLRGLFPILWFLLFSVVCQRPALASHQQEQPSSAEILPGLQLVKAWTVESFPHKVEDPTGATVKQTFRPSPGKAFVAIELVATFGGPEFLLSRMVLIDSTGERFQPIGVCPHQISRSFEIILVSDRIWKTESAILSADMQREEKKLRLERFDESYLVKVERGGTTLFVVYEVPGERSGFTVRIGEREPIPLETKPWVE